MAINKVKVNVNIKNGKPEEAKVESLEYFGPEPPKARDIYRCRVNRVLNSVSSNKNMMLSYTLIIEEPEDNPRSKYNGYPIFNQVVVTESWAGRINQMLDVISKNKVGVKRAFWHEGFAENEDHHIVNIGGIKITGVLVYVSVEPNTYNGKTRLKDRTWLMENQGQEAQTRHIASKEDEVEVIEIDDEEDIDDFELEPNTELDEEENEELAPDDSRRLEVEAMDRKELVAACRKAGLTATKNKPDQELVEFILEAEEVPF